MERVAVLEVCVASSVHTLVRRHPEDHDLIERDTRRVKLLSSKKYGVS